MLRKWQSEAVEVYGRLVAQGSSSFLLEATPGAGKTTTACHIALHQLKAYGRKRVAIVVPTTHLKGQWAQSAGRWGLRVQPEFRAGSGWPKGYQGIALTYQQVAARPEYYANLCRGAMAVLDEVHHAGDGLSWGEALKVAFDEVGFKLLLSGTPFRTDDNPIPFVSYVENESRPDFSYSYPQAIADGICRPVAFFTYGGQVAWEENGVKWETDFSPLGNTLSSRRLRVAISPQSEWIRPMLTDAHEMLCQVRLSQPEAGGLAVAANQNHARELADLLGSITGVQPVVALSDDAESSRRIAEFSADSAPWLVAVDMVSEGVDIPRLRVGVYASVKKTRMYFRQFLGRLVRVTPLPTSTQVAYCYMPADPVFEYLAAEVEEEQRHVIAPSVIKQAIADEKNKRPLVQVRPLLSVNPGMEAMIVNGRQLSLLGEQPPAQLAQVVQGHVEARLAKPPDDAKQGLVGDIKRLVGLYCRKFNVSYEFTYGQLNRSQGVRTQADCSMKQLEQRRAQLERWVR